MNTDAINQRPSQLLKVKMLFEAFDQEYKWAKIIERTSDNISKRKKEKAYETLA